MRFLGVRPLCQLHESAAAAAVAACGAIQVLSAFSFAKTCDRPYPCQD